MSKILDNIRSLRDEVVRPVSEGCKDGDVTGSTKWMGKKFKVRKKEKKVKKTEESFSSWLDDVNGAVEDICGMEIDILEGTDWRQLYRQGLYPQEAAQLALEKAEDEGEDEDERLQESAPRKPVYKRWSSKLDKTLRKRAGAAGVTEEDERPRSSLRRREIPVHKKAVVEDVYDPLGDLMQEFRVRPKVKPKAHEEVTKFMEEMDIAEPLPVLSPTPFAKKGLPLATPEMRPEPSQSADPMASALESIQRIDAEERSDKDAFNRQQEIKQRQDEDARAKLEKDNEGNLDEASVMGGDYGRWKPATSAAAAGGRALAVAISKATGMKHSFSSEGMAQSSDVGSDLWFSIDPKKSGENIYYLGVKIKGDKENPTWDVMLKKGKGLGSATSVASERGLETSAIKGAIGKLKSGLQSKPKEGE